MGGKIRSAGVAGVAILAMTAQSVAGGYASSCYERTYRPAQYDTVYEEVMVHPGGRRVEIVPPVYGTQQRRVVTRPGGERWVDLSAQYSYRTEKVLIEPARTVSHVVPAVTKVVHRKVLVSEGGYDWEWRIIHGKKVLCKIRRAPVYKTIAERVVVRPERVVRKTIPARWGYEQRKVLVAPASRESYVIAPEFGYVNEQVQLRPAEKRVHQLPPSYRTVAKKVKVREAEAGWAPVPQYCHD